MHGAQLIWWREATEDCCREQVLWCIIQNVIR